MSSFPATSLRPPASETGWYAKPYRSTFCFFVDYGQSLGLLRKGYFPDARKMVIIHHDSSGNSPSMIMQYTYNYTNLYNFKSFQSQHETLRTSLWSSFQKLWPQVLCHETHQDAPEGWQGERPEEDQLC